MRLEGVTHCYRYPRMLMYQLSSFGLHVPRHNHFTATVFYCPEDEETAAVVNFFVGMESMIAPPRTYTLNPRPLTRERLCARAIGRNIAAKETKADFVHYLDADYCIGPNTIDDLCKTLAPLPGPLHFPRRVWACEKDLGAELVEAAVGPPRVLDIPRERFVEHTFRVAIGGVQLVPGDLARRIGYLPDSAKHQRPSVAGWQPNREDKAFRRAVGTDGIPFEHADLYRIRHATRGAIGKDIRL